MYEVELPNTRIWLKRSLRTAHTFGPCYSLENERLNHASFPLLHTQLLIELCLLRCVYMSV